MKPTTRKLSFLAMMILIALVIVGCNNAPQSTTQTADDIDIATLPDTIDVQTANALKDSDDVVMIDVREQSEYDTAHIPGITLIPMSELESRVSEIPTDKTVILSCQSGVRSQRMFNYLSDLGFDNIHNMDGGIAAWQRAGLPVE